MTGESVPATSDDLWTVMASASQPIEAGLAPGASRHAAFWKVIVSASK